jgi:hypothetical protein
VLSSAGWFETMKLCDDISRVEKRQAGRLSFAETISILDAPPKKFGYDRTMVFYNDSEKLHWRKPSDALCDVRTGVICSPNNFQYASGEELDEGALRITALADFDRWMHLSEEQYRLEKLRWYDLIAASAVRFMPEFRGRVIDTDMFTPKTIRRFTWHDGGAVYGAPRKQLDGTTHLQNLYLCGTDQGFVGIIGSIISGITIANRHCLQG